MINLLVNIILFILRTINAIAFGVLDNLGVVYSILIFATLVVFVKLDSKIQICDFWRSSGFFIRTLVFTGVLFNALPQWYLWVAGVILVVLAYSLTPNPDEESEEPSILTKICDILIEEYHKSDLKKNGSKEKPKKSRRLPPVQ
jgi:hypothetical protein